MNAAVFVEDRDQAEAYVTRYWALGPALTADAAAAATVEAAGAELIYLDPYCPPRELRALHDALEPAMLAWLRAVDDANRERYDLLFGTPAVDLFSRVCFYPLFNYAENCAHLTLNLARAVHEHDITMLHYAVPCGARWEASFAAARLANDVAGFGAVQAGMLAGALGYTVRPVELPLPGLPADRPARRLPLRMRLKKLLHRLLAPRPRVLALGLAGELHTLLTDDRHASVRHWPHGAAFPEGLPGGKRLLRAARQHVSALIKDALPSLFLPPAPVAAGMPEHFSLDLQIGPALQAVWRQNAASFAVGWNMAAAAYRRERYAAVLWDSPPSVDTQRALICEYFRLQKVMRIGAQHGGHYGYTDHGLKHYYSDYWRCDRYLTWGFGPDHLRELATRAEAECRFIPAGSCLLAKARQQLTPAAGMPEPVEVLYVVTTMLPFFGRALRIADHELWNIQRAVLGVLAEARGRVIIKLPPAIGLVPHLRRELDRARAGGAVLETMPLRAALRRYAPRVIILDYLSTPLEECLVLTDAQLVVFHDQVLYPMPPRVRELLARRLTLCTEPSALPAAVRAAVSGRSPMLRDDSFVRELVLTDDAVMSRQRQALAEMVPELWRVPSPSGFRP